MWKKIRSFFSGGSAGEGADNTRHGDYTVRKNRKFDMIARVLAVLAALVLWIYVVSTTTVSEERDFSLIPVVCNGEETLRSEHGLVVQSISIDTLNARLMGNRQELRGVTADQVKAYISLAGIDKAGEYELKVYVDVPSGITLVSQTVSQVVVVVDRVSTKHLPVTSENLALRSWTLEDGCFFGQSKLNVTTLTLEGPTLALRKVASVELRSDPIGSVEKGFTVSVTPYLKDSEGNVINDSSLTIRETGKIEARVEVLKSKTVPLILQGKNGYLTAEQVSLTPSSVVITGTPDQVNATKSIVVDVVDETKLPATEERTYPLQVAEGLTVTDENKATVESVQVKFDLSALPTRQIEGVAVRRGSEIVGSVTVSVRGVNGEVTPLLQALTAGELQVFSNTDQPEGTVEGMTVVFDEAYRGSVYAVELSDYDPVPPAIDTGTDAEPVAAS